MPGVRPRGPDAVSYDDKAAHGTLRRSPAATQIRVRLGKPHVIARHDRHALSQFEKLQGMLGSLQTSAGRDRMGNVFACERVEQFLCARQDPERRGLISRTRECLLNVLGVLFETGRPVSRKSAFSMSPPLIPICR
jgi:hypothetical protein